MVPLPGFSADAPTGVLAVIPVAQLHPAQPSLGYREVNYRMQQFTAMTPATLDEYLREHYIPIAIAPNGTPFVVDHHHRAIAIQRTGLRETVYVKVLENCRNHTEAEFWHLMIEHQWVYRYDKNGNGPIDPRSIPHRLADLPDDVYRGLAWAVLRAGGYQKSDIPFQEFMWGNYLRQHLTFENTDVGFHQAVQGALPLCQLPAASSLPGFVGIPAASGSSASLNLPLT
ncbi:ParB-like protein [Neosynechococcus sphagnicola]|uniref:ParB-like protein n=1 Tax=Neosynechococcus sphagnicola TaxID=1501145 RepID=UPI00069123F2|nr:ParB-like protein [Neosynechococcus sphagnicola]